MSWVAFDLGLKPVSFSLIFTTAANVVRANTHQARLVGERARGLQEIDYLLGVNDAARQGALRFTENVGGDFLTPSDQHPIPPLAALSKLLGATEKLLNEEESDEDIRLLLAPGSSLGGARPKASIIDHDGSLSIAHHQLMATDCL